jgi:hypothetical protein
MGKLQDAMRYVGCKRKRKKKSTAADSPLAKHTSYITSREHLLGVDSNDNDSDVYSDTLSDKENDGAEIQEELEQERRLKDGYRRSLYNANKRIKSWKGKEKMTEKEVKIRVRMLELKELEIKKLKDVNES